MDTDLIILLSVIIVPCLIGTILYYRWYSRLSPIEKDEYNQPDGFDLAHHDDGVFHRNDE